MKAIYNFVRAIGLRSKFNTKDPISDIIPTQYFASDDNRLVLMALYIGNKTIATEMVTDYVGIMDKYNNQGALKFKYSLMEEICGIEEKEWAHKLEEHLPYEQRTAEVFSVIESPLKHRGIRGNVCNVSFATQDGYFISFSVIDTQDEVSDEVAKYFLSGQVFLDLLSMKKN